MWLTLLAAAAAHPFESRLYGHQTTVTLAGASVSVEYAVEIPTSRLLSEIREAMPAAPAPADQQAFNDRLHQDLRDALRLMIDGESVAWSVAEPAEDSGRGDVKFIIYRLSLSAPLPDDARTLQLIDGNYPDEPSIFQVAVLADETVILDASSQVTLEAGQVISSRDGQWRPEEDSRELRLSFRRRSALQARVWTALQHLGGQSVGLKPTAEALSGVRAPVWASLQAGSLPQRGVVAVLIGSLLTGGLCSRRRRALVGAVVLVGGGLAAVGLLALAGISLTMMLGAAGLVHVLGKNTSRSD